MRTSICRQQSHPSVIVAAAAAKQFLGRHKQISGIQSCG
jgi:hypothetical protein